MSPPPPPRITLGCVHICSHTAGFRCWFIWLQCLHCTDAVVTDAAIVHERAFRSSKCPLSDLHPLYMTFLVTELFRRKCKLASLTEVSVTNIFRRHSGAGCENTYLLTNTSCPREKDDSVANASFRVQNIRLKFLDKYKT